MPTTKSYSDIYLLKLSTEFRQLDLASFLILILKITDATITETSELEGEQAALLMDTIVRDVLIAGTTVQYANGRASRDAVLATDVMKAVEIRKAEKTLKKAGAKPFEDGYYHAIIDADQEFDLKEETTSNSDKVYSANIKLIK